MNAKLPRFAGPLAAALALALLAYRFANLDLVTFINDEPNVLRAAEAEAHGGGWVSASPIAGTQHLHYGPVPTWFYGLVHLAFGARPLASIVAMGLVVTLGQIAFAAILARVLRGGWLTFALVVLLVAASPFDFAWSRTAWDNTILLGTFSCGALLFVAGEPTLKRALGTGILFGLAVGTHLMVVPALAILFATMLWLRRDIWKRVLRAEAIAGAVIAVINVPYMGYLLNPSPSPSASRPAAATVTAITTAASHTFSITEAISTIVLTFLAPARILTTSGSDYFFDDAWHDFLGWLGPWSLLTHDGWWVVVLAGLAFTGLYFAAFRETNVMRRRVGTVALALWVGHALVLLADGLDPHPHYQHPVWWTVPTGIVLLLLRLQDSRPELARVVGGGVALVALVHFAFLPSWMGYVRARGGTAGIHYTTPLSEEEAFVRGACAKGDRIALENHTVIFRAALDYLVKVEPACTGKEVSICAADGCLPAPGTTIVRIEYAGSPGGRLMPP